MLHDCKMHASRNQHFATYCNEALQNKGESVSLVDLHSLRHSNWQAQVEVGTSRLREEY